MMGLFVTTWLLFVWALGVFVLMLDDLVRRCMKE